jgi:diketogulonate reductase-like aldo/keto reductase
MDNMNDLSKIGIGTWGIGGFAEKNPDNDDEKQVNGMIHALNRGLNFAELNYWYSQGKSIELFHQAYVNSGVNRDRLCLIFVIYQYNLQTIKDVENEIQNGLDLFNTQYMDSLQFNLSSFSTYGFDNVVNLVKKYLTQGKIHFTSVTNLDLDTLKRYHKIFGDHLLSHEVHFSFEVRENERLGLIPYADKHGIKSVIFQPLRRNRTALRNWPLLLDLAKKYNKTQNQIILNWISSKGYLPLNKAENIQHIDENLDAFNFNLSAEDVHKMDEFKIPGYIEHIVAWNHDDEGIPIHQFPNLIEEWYPV